MRNHASPSAREAVANPKLTRPDWKTAEPRDRSKLWLDKNENSDRMFAELTRRVVHEVVDDLAPFALHTYPDSAPFYRKLASQLGVDPANLLLAAGSDGVIRSVFEAFVAEGDRVMHSRPTFAMYAVYCLMYGANVTTLDYERSDKGPLLTADRVCSAIRQIRPKVMCLPNPDSPTGTVFELSQIRQIIEAAGEVESLILIDEAYHPFHSQTVVPWIRQFPHLVVARTFAKAWGVAGLRIGYAVASPEVTQLLHKVRPMYEVNTLAVAVMNRLLDYRNDMEACVARLNAGRDWFLSQMEQLGLPTIHCHGNFLHVAFGKHAQAIHSALEPLVLYRRDASDECLRGFSRFSAATQETFQPIVDRIRDVVQGRLS
ncbi:MAG TPA: aminotransferase class I/II-fold pyridoxal phosphate-dependent enzyme [Thermoanaerobaculia bacterium]|nr:aminotransferase class I/II-fold pyridoxal phosphate-dependent enzyme [Thermoanaerobaculia bacterium]